MESFFFRNEIDEFMKKKSFFSFPSFIYRTDTNFQTRQSINRYFSSRLLNFCFLLRFLSRPPNSLLGEMIFAHFFLFFFFTSENTFCRSVTSSASDDEHEAWDAPLRRQTVPWANDNVHTRGATGTNSKRKKKNFKENIAKVIGTSLEQFFFSLFSNWINQLKRMRESYSRWENRASLHPETLFTTEPPKRHFRVLIVLLLFQFP